MMKRAVLLLSILVLFLFSLTAGGEKYYAVSSSEWQRVNAICHTAGVAGPSSNGPVTADQLLLALARAEKVLGSDNTLLSSMKAELTETESIYSDRLGSVNLTGTLSPEIYAQSGMPFGSDYKENITWDLDGDWFIKNTRERRPLVSVTLENNILDFIYSRFSIGVISSVSKYGDSEPYWNNHFQTQLSGGHIYQNFPSDAGISIGTEGVSLIAARSRVSLGEGYTGNTAIGDNYDYQEFVKAGFYTEHTSVFLTLTSFDSSHKDPKEVDEKGNTRTLKPWDVLSSRFTGYRELRHSVDYEVTLTPSMRFSLAFITLLDTTSAFDIRYLNPFMIFHNYYNYHEETILEANNMITLDFSWSPAPKWNLYLQLTMDQSQVKGEAEGYLGFGYTEPNAYGGLFNVSYSDIVKDGILNVYAETVYNMPGMYLNSKFYDEHGNITQFKGERDKTTGEFISSYPRCFSQDYLLGYKRTESDYDDMSYSGYIYGGDLAVFALGGSYTVPGSFTVSSSLFYMAHGQKGRGEKEENYTFDGINTIDDVWRLALTGTVEHTLVIKAEGEWIIWKYLSLSLGAAYSYRWNYRNEEGKTFSNLQAYVGFTLSSTTVSL